MVKSMDIVDFSLSDDLPPRVVDKLNANFRRMARVIYGDMPAQYDILHIDLPIDVEYGGTGNSSFHENAVILGNASDPLIESQSTPGAFMSSANGAKPVFGTLPISFGGTGVTTLQELKNLVAPEGVMLFDSDVNTATSIQLTDSAANYKMFTIIFKDNDNNRLSTNIYEPDGKTIVIDSGAVESNTELWFKTSRWSISGNSITFMSSGEHAEVAERTNYNEDSYHRPLILITQVIGYKKANNVILPGDPAPAGDYNQLVNKPTITEPDYIVAPPGYDPANSTTVTIQGDQSFDDLGMKHLSNTELQAIINAIV